MKNRFRIPPQMGLNFSGEIIVDNFAGGGGASTGIGTIRGDADYVDWGMF